MPLHLQKLCVGAVSCEDMEEWIEETLERKRHASVPVEQIHTTRMMPSRAAEILDGGSLYWVIKGAMLARQRILALRPVTGTDGIARCEIVLEPKMIRVDPRPRRAFQGWRYLTADDAPSDLRQGAEGGDLPAHLALELRELGLL
ncbi:DUF1489 family protein [Terrihabitans sp. B22-R8]|uniref:DUF1489 family protein n=1 Tax=Terrihabitans sp. B22-R8 TaxID=3425128 RepID=UPI00403CCD92